MRVPILGLVTLAVFSWSGGDRLQAQLPGNRLEQRLRPQAGAEELPQPVQPPQAVHRAVLGISVAAVTDETIRRFGLVVRNGALITAVQPGSPAARAGLPIGGVIVAADGRRIDSSAELVAEIARAAPGQELELTYYQGSRLYRKTVVLAPAPAVAPPPGAAAPRPPLDRAADGAGERPLLRGLGRLIDEFAPPPGNALPPAPAVVAGSREVAALREQVAALQQQVELLQQRLDEVERRLAAAHAPEDER